jgi:acetoacetyl-CoA synthetase
VLDDPTMPGTRWFPNATLNYAEHALRTPGGADENHLAVLSIREDGSQTELTLTELRSEVGAAQAGLRRLGVGPGDRVVALVPNTVHALIGFLATAALGAVWSSCSPDFGAGSILDRFIQVEPTVLIAVDGYRYGGKSFRTDETVRKLLDALPSLAGAVHIPELDTPTPTGMIGWNELTARRAAPEFTAVPFSAPLWILYSSGTTGLPKPIVHSVGGILLEHLKSLGLQWDIGPGDRFLWFTTTGWMMWKLPHRRPAGRQHCHPVRRQPGISGSHHPVANCGGPQGERLRGICCLRHRVSEGWCRSLRVDQSGRPANHRVNRIPAG